MKPKKLIISLFIILTIWIQIATNLKINLSEWGIFQYSDQPGSDNRNTVSYIVKNIDWGINYFGWLTCLTTTWRMFGPPDRFNWYYQITARYHDGSEQEIPLPYNQDRSFIERNFIDFREAKFQLNMYNNKFSRDLYAQHLCREHSNQEKRVERILIERWWRMMKPIDKVKDGENPFYDGISKRDLDNFECREWST